MTRTVPSIYVLAGTDGAGKSSVAGAAIRRRGLNYFDPDEATLRIRHANPGMEPAEANRLAWLQGTRLLKSAIAARRNFAFEATLGGATIPALLEEAHGAGLAVRVWYVGLESAELHLARIRARVAAGGHDIPEQKVRERYDRSRENLIRLLPSLTALRLCDNSAENDPKAGSAPEPVLVLDMLDGQIRETCPVSRVPQWAKPIFISALREYLA